MPNYQNSKVYMLESLTSGLVYYGSTTQSLNMRLAEHRRSKKSFEEGKRNNVTSFKVLEHDDAKIILVCNCPCNSKEELLAIEASYIRNNDCVNKNIPGRTAAQYYQDNREKCDRATKQYRVNNKERISTQNKQYRMDNKEKIRFKEKQYRIDNKERIKQYRIDNKEYMSNKQKIKIKCVCGVLNRTDGIKRHQRTFNHINRIQNIRRNIALLSAKAQKKGLTL